MRGRSGFRPPPTIEACRGSAEGKREGTASFARGAFRERINPPAETIWRRVKGYLMPRRRYGSVEELRRAVAVAMERLRTRMRQGVLQSLCMGTKRTCPYQS